MRCSGLCGMGLWTVKQLLLNRRGITLETSYEEGARSIVWWPGTLPQHPRVAAEVGEAVGAAVSQSP